MRSDEFCIFLLQDWACKLASRLSQAVLARDAALESLEGRDVPANELQRLKALREDLEMRLRHHTKAMRRLFGDFSIGGKGDRSLGGGARGYSWLFLQMWASHMLFIGVFMLFLYHFMCFEVVFMVPQDFLMALKPRGKRL